MQNPWTMLGGEAWHREEYGQDSKPHQHGTWNMEHARRKMAGSITEQQGPYTQAERVANPVTPAS